MKDKRKKNLKMTIAAMGVAAGLVLVPTVAFAEGSFSSSLNQVQPGFGSRSWTDNNLDGTTTSVTLSGCKANAGGKAPGTLAIRSITIGLYGPNGYYSERSRSSCGTFSWGDMPKGTYMFRLQALNGVTATSGGRVFLNASGVSVKY